MQPFDRNIPYNSLPGLPPAEGLYKDTAVILKLAEASRKLAELKGVASMLPNQSIFVNTIALREAKASSAIENIFTTDDELYKALTYQDEDYVQGPAKEILHYREALWKGYAEIVKAGKLTVDAIIEIYRQVKQTHDGIRPYQAEIVIKKRGWGSLIGETVYTPPRGKGVVEKMLNDLVEFLDDDFVSRCQRRFQQLVSRALEVLARLLVRVDVRILDVRSHLANRHNLAIKVLFGGTDANVCICHGLFLRYVDDELVFRFTSAFFWLDDKVVSERRKHFGKVIHRHAIIFRQAHRNRRLIVISKRLGERGLSKSRFLYKLFYIFVHFHRASPLRLCYYYIMNN